MLLQLLGSIGLGLVSGWLAGLIFLPWPAGRNFNWTRLTVLAASVFTLGGVVFAWTGWTGALFFLIASLTSFLAQRAWRKYLGAHAKPHLSS